jgi:hypothetical protein
MASDPVFTSAWCNFTAQVSTANTGRDGSGTLVTPTWGGTGGANPPATDWMLKRLSLCQTGDLADCIMTMFVYDGTNTRLCYEYDFANPTAASATAPGYIIEVPFQDWTFPATWDLRFAITAAPTAGVLAVTGFCERL